MNQQPKRQYGNFVVALYDVLNQSEKLKKWDDSCLLDAGDKSALQAYDETAELIRKMRIAFRSILGGIVNFESSVSSKMKTEAQTKDIEEAESETIRHQSFSDTQIWFVRAMNGSGVIHVRQICNVLSGMALIHMLNIYLEVPARGAISFGCGTDSLSNEDEEGQEIYGPVLETAYRLEDSVAKYPRIVIHGGLKKYLAEELAKWSRSSIDQDSVYTKYMVHFLNKANSYILKDRDGQWILDYAGKGLADQLAHSFQPTGVQPSQVIQKALVFTQQQISEHIDSGDEKLLGRYMLLKDYLESRKQYW
ncbi:MAG: hypothetical protein JKY96_02890 [Phycisphaerales bacterium]|nr:hypothetical protein [Phycisphaerales bacterium]